MSTRSQTVSAFLLGRSRARSLQIVGVGVIISIGTGLLGRLVPLGAVVVYRSDIAGIIVGAILITGAAGIAYLNSGFVIVVVVHILLLIGLFASGGIGVYPESTMTDLIRLIIQFSVIIAMLLSTVGYAVGSGIRRYYHA